VGLKDVDKDDAKAIQAIIYDTLEDLVHDGVDKGLVDAAIHQYEFSKKEVTNSPLPYGLKLLLGFSGSWFHHGDPVSQLSFDEDLNRLSKEMAEGPFFENMIKEYFIDNPHTVLLTLYPDPDMARKQEDAEKAKLAEIAKALSPEELDKINADAKALEKLQETEEDLSCLPTLARDDIEPEVQKASPADAISTEGVSAYVQPTNGILYFTAIAKTDFIPRELIPLVPLFCHVFPKMGSKRRDYVELTRDLAAYTGGAGLASSARTCYDEQGSNLEMVSFDVKCLERNTEKMFSIIEELLFESSFKDARRLKDLVAEYVAAIESSVVSNGHRYALSLCSRGYSRTKEVDEQWHGIEQLQAVKQIAEDVSEDGMFKLSKKLEEIGRLLFSPQGVQMGLFGEEDTVKKAVNHAGEIQARLGAVAENPDAKSLPELSVPGLEAWTTSTSVSFVAHVFPTVRMAHEDAPALAIIAKMLRSLFLHREIREKGGAYGGFALCNSEEGLFGFASYRDPHIKRTMDVFSDAFDFICKGEYGEQDVTEAILQVCSDIDKPDAPSTMARKAFYRTLLGLTDQARIDYKKRIVAVNRQKVEEVAKRWFSRPERLAPVVVITSQSLLEQANEQADEPLEDFPIG